MDLQALKRVTASGTPEDINKSFRRKTCGSIRALERVTASGAIEDTDKSFRRKMCGSTDHHHEPKGA